MLFHIAPHNDSWLRLRNSIERRLDKVLFASGHMTDRICLEVSCESKMWIHFYFIQYDLEFAPLKPCGVTKETSRGPIRMTGPTCIDPGVSQVHSTGLVSNSSGVPSLLPMDISDDPHICTTYPVAIATIGLSFDEEVWKPVPVMAVPSF